MDNICWATLRRLTSKREMTMSSCYAGHPMGLLHGNANLDISPSRGPSFKIHQHHFGN